MALITNYTTLKTEIGSWLERSGDSDVTGQVATWIDLAEARLNRQLRGLRVTTVDDATLTSTIGSRQIDISSLSFLAPVSLLLTTGGSQVWLRPIVIGQQPLRTANATPVAWGVNGANIDLDAPADQAHSFIFRYCKALDIATDSSNWLLSNYPDVYLFESLKQAAIFFKDVQGASAYGSLAQQIIDEIRESELANFTGDLTVDPALLRAGGGAFDVVAG